MAVLPSPLSNSVQGINQSTVSGSIFGGTKQDPETKSTLQSLSSSVTSLQNQVNELSRSNIANVNVFANLNQSLTTQIGGVNLQLNKVNETLESIATITASESAIERQKDLYEQEKERRLAEAGARGGKESLLETKIQSALSEPVNRIGNKVSFGFQNLMEFIGTLLGGWLTVQGIKAIKAYQDGDKKQLNDIKDSVIKTLGIAGGIFLVINLGIGKVIGTIVGLTAKIGKFVIANTLGKLFQGMASLVKGAAKAVTGGGKEASAATKGITEGVEKGAGKGLFSGITKGFGKIAKTGFNLALGGFDFLQRKGEGQTNVQAGAGAVGSLATAELGAKLGSKFPGILKLPATLIGAGAGYYYGGKGADILTGVNKPKEKEKEKTQSKIQVKPTSAKPSQSTDIQSKGDLTKFAFSQPLLTTGSQPTTTPEKTSTSSEEKTTQLLSSSKETASLVEISSKPSTPEITPAQTTKMQTVPFNIGPEPEPKPNIIYASSNPSSPPPQQPLKSGPASDVPYIPSSNPDNFYTLYSQINYNVVM